MVSHANLVGTANRRKQAIGLASTVTFKIPKFRWCGRDDVSANYTRAFPTYPSGFPADVVDEFGRRTGRGVIGNVVGSGTDVIDQFGPEHLRTGAWIRLHVRRLGLSESRRTKAGIRSPSCIAPVRPRVRCSCAPNDVSRVIARPFIGEPGRFMRTKNRRDFSIAPPGETLLDALERGGRSRATGVGKVDDLFAGRGIRVDAHGEQRRGHRGHLRSGSTGAQVGYCSPT